MSNLVIVALPQEDELVCRISSEKAPHMTLLFLGEIGQVQNVGKILTFVEHAVNTTLRPFYLDVESRGVLGADEADVIYFKGWDLPRIKDFRAALLKNDAIFKAYNAETQFPEWIPHLTLGYPETPAKKLPNEHARIYSVYFDRIAVWVTENDGPEFKMKEPVYDLPEVAMSIPQRSLDDVLSHYGIKGMRWGHRKDHSPTSVTVSTTKKGRVKTTGGKNQPAHPDAVAAKVNAQKGKKSGIEALSNKELQVLANRLSLEKKVSDLAGDQMTSNGRQVLEALLAVS